MKRLNKRLVSGQLDEAIEEIDKIKNWLNSGRPVFEGKLQVMFEHLYYHINFAWNARYSTPGPYRHLSDSNFNRWSRFPKTLWEFQNANKKRKKPANKSLHRTLTASSLRSSADSRR